jgi:hypothetical protein
MYVLMTYVHMACMVMAYVHMACMVMAYVHTVYSIWGRSTVHTYGKCEYGVHMAYMGMAYYTHFKFKEILKNN